MGTDQPDAGERPRRRRLGRPDIDRYRHRFAVPPATGDGPAVTFAGVSTLLFDDRRSAVLFDGFFSRPSLVRVVARRIAPDRARIDAALARLGLGPNDRRLEAVVPVHSHFDHVMDAPAVVQRAGGVLLGGTSTANVGRGAGLAETEVREVVPGRPTVLGGWTLTHLVSAHCPPDRFPGEIDEPVVPPTRAGSYRCGEAWSVHVRHDSGRTALVQGSAGFVPGALDGVRADIVYLGIGQLGVHPATYIRDYWTHTVTATGARRVVLTHWDDFFRPLDQPLRALPYLGDDLGHTMSVLEPLAAEHGCHLDLPTVWRREDPWAGLT